jgi:endonuclease/exonuclease/phosphatase family metal-dependent hydrolase
LVLFGDGQAASPESMRNHCGDGRALAVDAPTLKVLTLNASHGRNTAINQLLVSKARTYTNLDAMAALLGASGADVVGLQEADAPSRWSGRFDHVEYLAGQAGFACLVHGLHSQGWLSTYGTALLSHTDLHDTQSVRFAPSPPSKQKGYVAATLRWQNEPAEPMQVTVVSVHFDFLRKKTRDGQVQEMVAGLSRVEGPLIVMGDFNSDWSDNDSPVRRLADKLDLSAYDPERDGLGTYKKRSGKRLDWILVSRQLRFLEYKVLPGIVADHFAVYAEIALQEVEK